MKRRALVPVVLALVLGGVPAGAAPSDPYLFSRPAHPTFEQPDAAISADLDEDGRQDVISAVGATATASWGVSVLRGTAKGFAEPTFAPLPSEGLDVAVADVDRNGFKDVVASAKAGEMRAAYVLTGFGDGTLDLPVETAISGYRALAVGEFVAGRTGAVVATDTGLAYWKANGIDFELDREISDVAAIELLAIDMDGDGVDEVVASDGERVLLYKGFSQAGSSPLGEVISLTAADVDNDAKPEAIATSGGGDVKAFNASMASVRSIAATNAGLTAGAGNLDGDGKADLVRVNDVSTLTVAFGNGTRKDVSIAQNAVAVFVRDATGDGHADILAVEKVSSVLEVVEGDGAGGFSPQRSTVATQSNGWTTKAADFNNDGKLDVIAAELNYILGGYTATTTASVLLGNGSGGFTRGGTISTQGATTGLDVGDVNGDGKVDVVVSDYHSSSVIQYLGNGNGTFGDARHLPGCPLNDALVVGNFNGDAYADVAAACRGAIFQQTVAIYLGSPAGLTPGAVMAVAHSNAPWGLYVGDLNGDQKQDIIMDSNAHFKVCVPPSTDCLISSSYDGPFSYFLGLGNGLFEPESRDFVVGRRIGDPWVGDINGDGRGDLVTPVFADDQVQVTPGKADGTLGTPYQVQVPEYPFSVTAADLTGDGKLDLVTRHGPTMISVTRGNGDGTFGESTAYVTRSYGALPIARDFTGDGKPDVFLPMGGFGELFVNGR